MTTKQVIKKSALSPTVLIVGGAGFIGSHLAEALLAKDARVIVVDNFSTGKDLYVQGLLKDPKFALFDADVNLGLPPEIESVDYIFHLAGLETYLFERSDVNLDSLLTNAIGTKIILDFTKKSAAKMLLASSVDVYKGVISPIDLEHYFGQTDLEEKKYSITEAKRYAEALVWEYYKKHRIDVRVARLPEVYGPRMSLTASAQLGSLIKELVEGHDLTVYGEGTEKEYYLYISDAVSGLIKALFSGYSEGKIYTFTEKEPRTTLEVAYLLKSLANVETKVVFKPEVVKVKPRLPTTLDRTNLKEIGWIEKVSFEKGLINSLTWLGYEPSKYTFKPNKLIDDKQKEKATGTEAVDSIANSIAAPPQTVTDVVTVSTEQSKIRKRRRTFSMSLSFGVFWAKVKNLWKNPFGGRSFSLVRVFGSKQPSVPKAPKPPKPTKQAPVGSAKVSRVPWTVYVFFFLLSALVFIGVPILQTYVHSATALDHLTAVQDNAAALNFTESQTASNEAYKEFKKAQESLTRLTWLFVITGQTGLLNDIQRVYESAEYSAKGAYFLSKGSQPFVQVWQAIQPESEVTLDKKEFSQAAVNYATAKENLLLAEAALKGITRAKPQKLQDYQNQIGSLLGEMDTITAVSENLPALLGVDGKKTYLILFQNSNELRATGGFIGSYAKLDLEDGKITRLLIDDVYNPDGQLDVRDIQVTPPAPIAEYLDEDRLHIRNANWDPSFPVATQAIEDLFFKIDGQTYDGVLAVDLHFVEKLLHATGPLFLTAYNEEITVDNLYERAQFHSEFNYQEGSEQKKSFLTILSGKLLETVFAMENEEIFGFVSVFEEALAEKHVLVNIPKSPINALLDARGWNGKLIDVQGDYLYVVNTNLGGTKANYYVENSMDYGIFSRTRDGMLRAELALTYTHTGQDMSWPGGPYTNYVRVLAQDGSRLTGAKVLKDGNIQDVFSEVQLGKSGKYTEFAYGFVLDPKNTLTLIFEYDLPDTLAVTTEGLAYDMYWQKQPGTRGDAISFKFSAPFGTEIVNTVPQMTIGGNTAEYSDVLTTDTVLKVDIK